MSHPTWQEYQTSSISIGWIKKERIEEHPAIKRSTKGGLSTEVQLLVALRYYATGNSITSLKTTGDFHLSHGSVYKCIKNVSVAL